MAPSFGALVLVVLLSTQLAPAQRRNPLALSLGTLYLPAQVPAEAPVPLVIFFHGAGGIETAANENRSAVISVYFPTNSDPYVATFNQPDTFTKLMREAEAKANLRFGPLTLGCFSAGCGAVRVILRDPEVYERTQSVVAIDGIYADFAARNTLAADQMEPWLKLARDSVAGHKQFLVTHTDVETGAYATAKVTADWMLYQLNLKRHAASPGGRTGARTQAEAGGFVVKGFPGVESVHHLGQLNLIGEFLRLLSQRQ